MKTLFRVFELSLLSFLAVFVLFAGNTGKITGRVSDSGSGEAIIGVNVLVVGTTRGATTDLDGKYTIIGVPIGTYKVQASQVGYTQVTYNDVKVGADETTTLNFKLSSSAVTLTGIEINADKQLVNSMATGSTQNVSQKTIESIPNVKNVEDVLKLQAGVVKQGNNIFVRGGRPDEVQYLVDGIPTNNILGSNTTDPNATLSQIYSGQGAVGSGLTVSANAIASVSVQTGGFDADYGNAQSGVINITTKSGSEKYTGSMQYRTDKMANTNENEAYSSFAFGGPEPLTKYLLPSMGMKIPGSLTFFFNADVDRSDGYSNYAKNEFYNPVQRKIALNGFLGGLMNGVGFKYLDNQNNTFTFNSKLRYDPNSSDQISYGYRASLSSSHDYRNDWKYRADSSIIDAGLNIQHNLSWSHFFNSNSFIKLYLAKLEQKSGNDIAGIAPPEYSTAYRYRDVTGTGFNVLGTEQTWKDALSTVWTLRFDLNSQVHPLHYLKTGFEFNYEGINSTIIVNPTVAHTNSQGEEFNPPDPASQYSHGDYPGYGQYRWHMNNFPNHGGAYVQDNIEFSGLNIHVGLRYDYFDIGKQVFDSAFIDAYRTAVGANLNSAFEPQWAELNDRSLGYTTSNFSRLSGGSSFLWYMTHGNFSPRLSIGYPVTDRIVFYFNYGHFLQYPSRDQYYQDAFVTGYPNNVIGNPDLKPKRTVSYEAGFDDQFADDMAFSLHAFYKDIFDYPQTIGRGNGVYIYTNLDYASTRGFEVTFNQSFTGNFSANLTYAYQLAKGRASNPLASILEPQFQLPRETRLDWDQNHTANVFVTYKVGANEEGHFFGLPFVNNYRISLTWNFGSGFPYNGFYIGRQDYQNVYLKNSETAPYTSTLNLTINKGFRVMNNFNLEATLDILNLLNRRNVINVGNGVDGSILSYTGGVKRYGDVDPNTVQSDIKYALPWYQTEHDFLNPAFFDAPRQILLGVRLNWD